MENEMALYDFIAAKIKELRSNYGGKGIKQEELAKAVGIQANTVSRWETVTYKPSVRDLQKLSDFFGVSISTFFPQKLEKEDSNLAALASATGDLPKEDINELIEYANYRRARRLLEPAKK